MPKTGYNIVFSISVICLLSIAGYCHAQHPRYMGEAMFEGTMDDFQMGRYAEAVTGFKKFLELAPNDFNGHYLLAHSLRYLGRNEEAVEYYEKALAIKPTDYDARLYAGVLYRDLGDYDKAAGHFEKARDILPGDPEAIVNLGVLHRLKGDRKEAHALFELAVSLDSTFIQTYVRAAEMYRLSSDRENAVRWIDRGLAVTPSSFDLLLEAGNVSAAFDDFEKAEELYLKAKDLKPNSPAPYRRLAVLYEKRGQSEKAAEYANHAESLTPRGVK